MAQRRFGPTRGAGVVIIEQSGDQQIEPGALGWVGYAGIWERGPVGKLSVITGGKSQFLKRHGSYIEDSLAPDAAQDFFDVANGAGGMLVVRVTDGNEEQAEITLFQRQADGTDPIAVPVGKVKAANGGRWGGKERLATGVAGGGLGDFTETTLDTGLSTFTTDQWKGGFLELEDVPNVRYEIVGNDAAGVITVSADSTLLTDMGAGSTFRWFLVLENEDKEVRVLIGDGEDNPTTEFSLTVFVDGDLVKKYPNLNTNPASGNYWESVINNDDANDEIEVEDLVVGAHTAITRPANHYGVIDTVTATILTAKLINVDISSPTGGDATWALGTTDDTMVEQTLTLTFTSPTDFDVVSDKFGALGSGTLGAAFSSGVKWVPDFTGTAGGTPHVAADVVTIQYRPLRPGDLVGGLLYPDKVNARRTAFRITANTHSTITVAAGSDLTVDGAANDQFLVEASTPLVGGKDGNADLVDADFEQQAWDVDNSPFNDADVLNLGLIKFASPGTTATAVQKAGQAYAEARNHQYRYEIPAATTTESGAEAYVNDTLGRSDYVVASFPSYGDVADPEATTSGKRKTVPLTGKIHGREARIASDFEGYHKAEAGIDATLPGVLAIPTGDRRLNEEILNPAGLSVIKKNRGNFVIWGDRTLYRDPTWKFKHQRELMSYYEQVLQSNFDFIIFAINDSDNDADALTTLKLFFLPEFVKRAIRGDTFEEAAIIKVDSENNTDATRAAGDQFADISLRLADTVERFIIRIGKQGIFESVA